MSAKLCGAALGLAMALAGPIAPASGTSSDIVSLKLDKVRLQLEERGTVCFIRSIDPDGKERAYSLDIPYPCAFHKDKAGDIRIVRSGKYEYALVESSRNAGIGVSECETHLRSIRIAGKQLQISRHKDKVASCPPFQWDRIMFTELFN